MQEKIKETPEEKTLREKKERGRAVAEWLRSAMKNAADPVTKRVMSASDLARISGVSATRISVTLNDCVEKSSGLVKIPSAAVLEKLARPLGANVDEGKAAAGLLPSKSTDTVFRPEPGMERHDLSDGSVLFTKPGEGHLAELYESFLFGRQSVIDELRNGGN